MPNELDGWTPVNETKPAASAGTEGWTPVDEGVKAAPAGGDGWAPVDKSHLIDLTAAYARKHGIREDVFLALHQQESGFDPNAKSPTGVKGISQMTLATGRPYGIKSDADRLDPHKSLDAAGAHFADLLQENGGSYSKALKAYGGPTDPRYEQNVGRHLGWARKTLEGRQPLDLNAPAPQPEQPDMLAALQPSNEVQPVAPGEIAPQIGAHGEAVPEGMDVLPALKAAGKVLQPLAEKLAGAAGEVATGAPYAGLVHGRTEPIAPEEEQAGRMVGQELTRGAYRDASLGLIQPPEAQDKTANLIRTVGGYIGMAAPLTRLTKAGVAVADLMAPEAAGTAFSKILGSALGFGAYGGAAGVGETVGKEQKFDNATVSKIVDRSIDDYLLGGFLSMGVEGVAAGLQRLFAPPEIGGMPGTEFRKTPTPGAPGGETFNLNPQSIEEAIQTYDYLRRTGGITGRAVRGNPYLRTAATLYDRYAGKSAEEIIADLKESKPFRQAEAAKERAAKEATPIPESTPEPKVQEKVTYPQENVTQSYTPTPAPRPENAFQAYIMQTGGHQGDPAAMAQDMLSKRGPTWAFSPTGMSEIASSGGEVKSLHKDLALIYARLHPDQAAHVRPDEIWQHLNEDDMRSLEKIPAAQALLGRIQTAATLRMAEAQQELLGQQSLQEEKDAIAAQVAQQKQAEAVAKAQQKEVEQEAKAAEKEAQQAAKEAEKGKLRRVKKVVKVETSPQTAAETPDEALKVEANAPGVLEGSKEPWEMTRKEFLSQPTEELSRLNRLNVIHEDEIKQALAAGKPVPEAVLKDYPDLAAKPPEKPGDVAKSATSEAVPNAPEKGGREVPTKKPNRLRTKAAPTTTKEFSQQQGTAKGIAPEAAKPTKSKERMTGTNWAQVIKNEFGGISPESLGDYVGAPEEKQKLRLTIVKKGARGADLVFEEFNSAHPGIFKDAEDMVRYFVDGRHERELKSFNENNEQSIQRAHAEYVRQEMGLNPEEWGHYTQLFNAEAEVWLDERISRAAEEIKRTLGDIDTQARTEALTSKRLTEIEADVAQEIVAEEEYSRLERDAKQHEGTEPWEKELDQLYPKTAFFLTPPIPKTPKLTKRLDALQSEYPDIDRERAALVIRSLPEAEDFQIAAMSADPAMFNQVAKGNLAASEKAQLFKKATDAGQQMGLPGLTAPGRLFSLAPSFYSQMAVSLEAKLPGKGDPAQLASLIEGWTKKGDPKFPIKADELKWSGLLPWLKEQKGSVTKAKVAEFLKENQVEVREVQKGEPKSLGAWEVFNPKDGKAVRGFDTEPEAKSYADTNGLDYAESGKGYTESPTKFSGYMKLPPGGENYREVLLTVPLRTTSGTAQKLLGELKGKYGPDWQAKISSEERTRLEAANKEAITSESYQVPGGHSYGDSSADLNRFAHIFMDDRVIDGKKYLTIWELQSDWGQEGRRKGYKEGEWSKADESRYNMLSEEGRRNLRGSELAEFEDLIKRRDAYNSGVPPFPFAKNWHEVAMKKALRMAAEEGYDGVAWATGDMVKDRYDLSKQIDSLDYQKNPDDTYKLSFQKDHQGHMIGEAIPEKELEKHIGKDVAAKIIEGQGKKTNFAANNEKPNVFNRLSNLDLKVGGEWANRQYDQMMPQFLNKYGKQWGAKVGEGDIVGRGYKEYFIEKNQFFGGYSVFAKDTNGEIHGPLFERLSEFDAKRTVEDLKTPEKDDLIHTLPISLEMKQSVLTKGQPLYKLPEEGAPNAPGQRTTAAGSPPQPQDRSERLARTSERLERELGGFRARRDQEFAAGRLSPADAKIWQEVTYNPVLLTSPEFQAITAAAKAVGISEVLPIKSKIITGCIHPEDDGRQIMLLSDVHLGSNSLTNVAGHETFHFRLNRRDWPAVKLFRVIDSRSPLFQRYKKYLDRAYRARGLEPLSIPQIKDEIAANIAGGITVPGFDFTQAVFIAPEDLQAILTDYRTLEMASQQAQDGDLVSKFFLDAPEDKAAPPLTKKEKEMGSTILSMGLNPEQFKIAKRGLDHLLGGVFNKFNDWGIRLPGKITRRAMNRYVPTELQRQGIVNWLRHVYFPEHVAQTRPAFRPMRQADLAAGDKSAELRQEIWGRMQPYFKELNPESRAKVDALLMRLDKIQKLDARKRLEEKVAERGFEYFKGFKGNLLNDLEAKAVYGIWDAMRFIRQDLTGSMLEHLADYGAARGLEPEKARRFAGEIALNLDKPVGQVIAEYLPEIKAGTVDAQGKPATEEVVIGGQKFWTSEEQAKDIAKKVGIESIRIDKQAKGYVIIGPAESAGPKAERVVSGIEKTLQKQRDTIQFWLRDRAFYLLPHTRWGPFWVRVFNKEGKMVWAGAPETTTAAKQMLENAKSDFGEGHAFKMTREDRKPMELYNNVNMPAVSAIMELAKDKLPADSLLELMEAWQTFWAAKGWDAHLIHRSNILGFETGNLLRTYSDYIEGYIGMRSKMTRANGFTKAWEGFTDREGGNDPALQRYTLEYTRYLLDHPYEYSWIRRILYHTYLGASMGFRLLHALHAVQTAWPVLSVVTKGSAAKLSKAYADRYALSLEKMGVTGKTHLVTDRERQALEIGKRHEALQDSYQQEIAAKAGSPFYRWLYDDPTSLKSKSLDLWKNIYYPGESDKWLREGMFLASLRALDPEFSTSNTVNREAIDQALKLTQDAFFRYARGDRPPIGRGLGAIWFTFQTWVTKYFQLLYKLGTGGVGPKAIPGKTQGGGMLRMLLAALAIGGTTGAGIYGVTSRVYRKITGRHLADDVKAYAQAIFGEKAGSFASRTVINGLPASIFGFDLSQRMVHHLPLVEEKDRPESWGKKLTGAVSGPFEKVAQAGAALEKEEPRRALEAMLPNFIGNPIKAQRLYSQDPTTLSGRPILGEDLKPHRLGMTEAVMKGVGVQPIRLSEEESRRKFANLQEQDLKAKKDKFVTRLSKAVRAGDEKGVTQVVQEIAAYNQAMLKAGREADIISDQSIRSSVQQRMKPVVPDANPKKMLLRQRQGEKGLGIIDKH